MLPKGGAKQACVPLKCPTPVLRDVPNAFVKCEHTYTKLSCGEACRVECKSAAYELVTVVMKILWLRELA